MAHIPGGRLLRQRNFRLSLISEVVNRFGDSVVPAAVDNDVMFSVFRMMA